VAKPGELPARASRRNIWPAPELFARKYRFASVVPGLMTYASSSMTRFAVSVAFA
jgi:hypothetical protein